MTKEEFVSSLEEKVLKVAKFKTHKQRKSFFGEIKQLVEDFSPTPPAVQRYSTAGITKPNKSPTGNSFTIMTEGLSAKGDDVLQNHKK